jgi:hypothetical protein
MNDHMQDGMAEATRLTRAGRLTALSQTLFCEATSQREVRGGAEVLPLSRHVSASQW